MLVREQAHRAHPIRQTHIFRMATSWVMTPPINNEIFADYLRCQYKAYLKLKGRTGQKTEYEELQNKL